MVDGITHSPLVVPGEGRGREDKLADHIAHSQQLLHKRLGIELFEVINVLPIPDEDDGGPGCSHGRQRPTAFGVAVQLGDDHRPHLNLLAERLGLRLA